MIDILDKLLFIKLEDASKDKEEKQLIAKMWEVLSKGKEEILKVDLKSLLLSIMDCNSQAENPQEENQHTFALFKTNRLNNLKPISYINQSSFDGDENIIVGPISAKNSFISSHSAAFTFSPKISEIDNKYAESARQKILNTGDNDRDQRAPQMKSKNFLPDFLVYKKLLSNEYYFSHILNVTGN